MPYEIKIVLSKPYQDQKPGTSGLRKQVPVFQQPNYTENFVQAVIEVALQEAKRAPEEVTLIVGGDGRYYSKTAIHLIIAIAAANRVGKLVIAKDGIMSTPAVSAMIRDRQADGGIILTASHNPGGPDGDFGIKFNCENGGPAPTRVTKDIYKSSMTLSEYVILEPMPAVDISKLGQDTLQYKDGETKIEVIDGVADYSRMLKQIFDFPKLKAFLCKKKILIDAMHGVMGPYVQQILVQELGAPPEAAIRCNPLQDFGGHHPDPNLTYAADLVSKLKQGDYFFGAAFDGDGDRNMILGEKGFFVTPSDSLAVLSDNLEVIPYFSRHGVHGYARSMPTSRAVDLVSKAKAIPVFETPTGWKYFGDLMDAGQVSICGEESFGTGSDHIREKDGLWAVLAWLSLLEAHQPLSVSEVVHNLWNKYGRFYYNRYDYENCESEPCERMMEELKTKILDPSFVGTTLEASGGVKYKVEKAFDYAYHNRITGITEAERGHGLVVLLDGDKSRVIFRLSGTGSSGATVRVYLEHFLSTEQIDPSKTAADVLAPLVEVSLKLAKLTEFTGRTEPTVIT